MQFITPAGPRQSLLLAKEPDQFFVKTLYTLSESKLLSRVRLFATPWTVAYQASQSTECSRQEYWSGLPFPSPGWVGLFKKKFLDSTKKLYHAAFVFLCLVPQIFCWGNFLIALYTFYMYFNFCIHYKMLTCTTGKTIALTIWTFVGKVILCFLVHCLGLS